MAADGLQDQFSPYASMADQPGSIVDPTGLDWIKMQDGNYAWQIDLVVIRSTPLVPAIGFGLGDYFGEKWWAPDYSNIARHGGGGSGGAAGPGSFGTTTPTQGTTQNLVKNNQPNNATQAQKATNESKETDENGYNTNYQGKTGSDDKLVGQTTSTEVAEKQIFKGTSSIGDQVKVTQTVTAQAGKEGRIFNMDIGHDENGKITSLTFTFNGITATVDFLNSQIGLGTNFFGFTQTYGISPDGFYGSAGYPSSIGVSTNTNIYFRPGGYSLMGVIFLSQPELTPFAGAVGRALIPAP